MLIIIDSFRVILWLIWIILLEDGSILIVGSFGLREGRGLFLLKIISGGSAVISWMRRSILLAIIRVIRF